MNNDMLANYHSGGSAFEPTNHATTSMTQIDYTEDTNSNVGIHRTDKSMERIQAGATCDTSFNRRESLGIKKIDLD